jgi:single-strand DNA-binding protein
MVNRQILVGRLGAKPELKHTPGGTAFATFQLATEETFSKKSGKEKETTWHRVVAWAKLGEICARYLDKGSLVYVEGRTVHREYQDKDGKEKKSDEVHLDRMKMLGGGRREEEPSEDLPF